MRAEIRNSLSGSWQQSFFVLESATFLLCLAEDGLAEAHAESKKAQRKFWFSAQAYLCQELHLEGRSRRNQLGRAASAGWEQGLDGQEVGEVERSREVLPDCSNRTHLQCCIQKKGISSGHALAIYVRLWSCASPKVCYLEKKENLR